MKRPVKIIVEGIADIRFVQDYVSFLFGEELKESTDIIKINGWNNLILYAEQLKKNSDDGGVNLVIFDADANCESRREEILQWKTNNNLSFELFLFPDNSLPGALEELLERIINPDNSPIFDCWQGYENCLSTKQIPGRESLTLPAKKTKIYGYLEALLGENRSEKEKIKERKRNYKDPALWNLEAEALSPLKDFLLNNLQ